MCRFPQGHFGHQVESSEICWLLSEAFRYSFSSENSHHNQTSNKQVRPTQIQGSYSGQMAQDLITKTYKSSFKAAWELHHSLLLTSKSDCLLNHDWRQANKLQFPLPRCVWAVYLPLLRKGEWVGNMQVCERGSGWSLLDAADARPSALQCLKALGCALSTNCHQCKQLRQSKAIKGSTMREFKQNSSVSRSGILFEAKASSLTPVTPTLSTLHPSC